MNKILTTFLAASAIMLSSTNLEAANNKRPTKKDWTVAIFLNADNNLDYFGVEDQNEMSKVGSNDFMNVVTLIDRVKGPAQINYIEKGNINKVKDMGELDMGDYKEFVKFVEFIKENYPAKHYCFNIWNHGSGWKNKGEKAVVRGISYDDSSSNHITTPQLSIALKEAQKILGKNIDVIGFDACLMQMVEVCYACKDYADYMVASEEVEPGKGAPYDEILKDVKKGMSPADFADNWVGSFLVAYSEGGNHGYQATTQSAVDLSKMNKLADAISGFSKAIIAGNHASLVRKASFWSQHYADRDNIDLISLLDSMKDYLRGSNDTMLLTAMEKVRAAVKEAVIANSVTSEKLGNSNGIAIFLPDRFIAPAKYKELSFAKETMWDEMLEELAKRTVIQEVIEDVKKGKTASLKKAVATAKKESNNSIYRSLLKEINRLYLSENAVPNKSKNEVEKLLNDLKKTIKR